MIVLQRGSCCRAAHCPPTQLCPSSGTLTEREGPPTRPEIASGSHREIAQRLVVSVRTVENHLYRASTKLGTTDRAKLTAPLHHH
jgi:DNA-binding NarL/FixJ family response regulator